MKMSFTKEELRGLQPLPGPFMYELIVKKIELKKVKDPTKTTKNLNIMLEVTGHATLNGRIIFDTINSAIPGFIQDFVHGCGLTMEPDLPGEFFPDATATAKDQMIEGIYKGPLLGRKVQAEVVESSYNNKPGNKVKQYICKVQDCSTRFPEITHSTNHVGK